MTTYRFDPDRLTSAELDTAQAWLRANGLNPDDIPTDAKVAFRGGRLDIEVFKLRDGRKYLDGSGRAARHTITVELRKPAPAGLHSLRAVTR